MSKRIICLGVSICLVLAIFPFFIAYADESATALYTLTYDWSNDNGSTWTERTMVLNYENDLVLYANQKVRLKSIKVERINYTVSGYIYFFIKSTAFSSRPSYNLTSGTSRFYTYNGAVWGCIFPEISSYTFNYSETLSGFSSGSVTYTFEVSDSFNYGHFLYEIIDYLDETWNELISFHYDWNESFLPHFDQIWTIMTQTNYSYQGFAGNGQGLNSLTTKNPMQAINNHLSALVRYFNKIQKNDYSYDSISYDSDGIGTVTTVSNVPWFDAMLGQLQGQSAIEQHHMELENQAMETGLGDLMNDAYTSNNISFGVGLLSGIFSFGDLGSFSSYHPDVDNGYGWFSSQNKNMIDAVVPNRSEEIVDFYSNNLAEILGKGDE